MASSPSNLQSHAYRTALIASTWLCSLCILIVGCEEKRATGSDSVRPAASAVSRSTSAPSVQESLAKPPDPVLEDSPASPSSVSYDSSTPELDLGTPAPVVLGKGVMVAKDKADGLLVSRLQKGRFEPVTAAWEEVSPWPVSLASGSTQRAYWVSRGRLVRREIASDGSVGALTVLATDAVDGSPVSAARSAGATEQDVVLYAGRKQSSGEWAARLWVEGQGSRSTSRDAGSVTSLSLVHLGLSRFALLKLDGRLGMSPVHAVSLELDVEGVPHLGEDRVVYVAGSAERGTALTGILVGRGPVVLLPISKDAREFGLLLLRVGYGDGEAPSEWVDYPNGLDPAPVAAANVCGQPTAAFVRPAQAAPKSLRVLEVGRLDGQGVLRDCRVMATAANIPHIDLWGDKSGGWLVYAMEEGLRGRRIECK